MVKILGNTPEGDLIISVSQAEWDGLQDGVKLEDDRYLSVAEVERWQKTEVYQGLDKMKLPGLHWLSLGRLFKRGKFDGTWESLAVFNFVSSGIGTTGKEKLRDIAKQQLALKDERP